VCWEKISGNIYAMKWLKKPDVVKRGQVRWLLLFPFYLCLSNAKSFLSVNPCLQVIYFEQHITRMRFSVMYSV
jgi:hypothetical protein